MAIPFIVWIVGRRVLKEWLVWLRSVFRHAANGCYENLIKRFNENKSSEDLKILV